MDMIKQVMEYVPFNEQEKHDKELIINLLKSQNDILTRENQVVHVSVSAWVVNQTRTKVLMIHHNIYNSWAWLGGHADGEDDLLAVAMREVREESGLQQVKPVISDIFSLELLTVDGHEKNNQYVSSHLHLNITYLLEADENEVLSIKRDENSGVAWFGLEEAVEASTEPWFQSRIYRKLNEKLKYSNFI